MKKLTLLAVVAVISCHAFAQKASDVLEKGIYIKQDEKVYLHLENNKVQYDIAKSRRDPGNTPNPMPLEDNTLFLIQGQGVNIYAAPVNPLNFAYSTTTEEILDPIDEEVATVMSGWQEQLPINAMQPESSNKKLNMLIKAANECVGKAKAAENALDAIYEQLKNDKKGDIVKVLKKLEQLSFLDEDQTIAKLQELHAEKESIEKHFSDAEDLIGKAKDAIQNYNSKCSADENHYLRRIVYNQVLNDAVRTLAEQKKRLKNLQTIYDVVVDAQVVASSGVDGVKWLTKLNLVPSRDGKIQVYTITVADPGYTITDDNEIVKGNSKELQKVVVRMRKFQRFVPEVSAGIAYTFFKYNTYKTVTDSAGVMRVAEPVENDARNVNITSMINWVYYAPNTNIRPLYQIGLGINAGIPTLVTGVGIRTNMGKQRIAITGGIALTWLRELDKLHVGDAVAGESVIENDLKHQFVWPPKGYVGLQYNF